MNWFLAGPEHLAGYLITAAALFALGVLACTTRRNAVGFLMGVELMLNGAALNFVAFDRFRVAGHGDGQIAGLFIIALAAAEAAVALALVYAVYRTYKDVDLEATTELRG
jgi:NADH:ubiquinone oxidoreductase subunit K